MKYMILIVMFASAPAAAREFTFDAEALGRIAAGTRDLKVKHQGRRIVIDYDAIRRQNMAGAWSQARNPRECELFDEIIRLGVAHPGR